MKNGSLIIIAVIAIVSLTGCKMLGKNKKGKTKPLVIMARGSVFRTQVINKLDVDRQTCQKRNPLIARQIAALTEQAIVSCIKQD